MAVLNVTLLAFLTVGLTFIAHTHGAAVRSRRAINTLPTYDDGFMRKLCVFLGAKYVRSAKDPMCWYTWCHSGQPYHMQCAPGRSVSKHFYWSSDDPCTEIDTEEKCIVGYLKKMHLPEYKPNEVLKMEDVGEETEVVDEKAKEEIVEEREEVKEEKEEKAILVVDRVVEGKQLRSEVLEQFTEPELVVNELSDNGKIIEEYPAINTVAEVDEKPESTDYDEVEPIPEPEPISQHADDYAVTAKPKFIIRQIKPNQRYLNYYYPRHGHAHIVDRFVLQNSNHRKYGMMPRQMRPYIPVYYSPRPYLPRYRTPQGIRSPVVPQSAHAQYLRNKQPYDEVTRQQEIIYKKPEGRQAPISNAQSEEPLYDTEYINEELIEMATDHKHGQDDDASQEIEPISIESAQQLAIPHNPHVLPMAPTVSNQQFQPTIPVKVEAVATPSEKGNDYQSEELTGEIGLASSHENGNIVENIIQEYDDEDGERIIDGKPVTYDYFKTHFIESI